MAHCLSLGFTGLSYLYIMDSVGYSFLFSFAFFFANLIHVQLLIISYCQVQAFYRSFALFADFN